MATPKVAKTKEEETQKICFFITPVSSDNSDIRRSTDGLIDSVLEPLLDEFDIELISPHRISKAGSITSQVIKLILNSDLVIANLTTLNPNVMYELAVRHATGKQVICIADNTTKLPFDILPERTFFFKNDMMGVKELKETLRKVLPEILEDEGVDNPITREIKDEALTEGLKIKYKGDKEDIELIEFFNRKFDELEVKLEQSTRHKSWTQKQINEFVHNRDKISSDTNYNIVTVNFFKTGKVKITEKDIELVIKEFNLSRPNLFKNLEVHSDERKIKLVFRSYLPVNFTDIELSRLRTKIQKQNSQLMFGDVVVN